MGRQCVVGSVRIRTTVASNQTTVPFVGNLLSAVNELTSLQTDISGALFPSECLFGDSFNKLSCRTRRELMSLS